MTYNNLSTLAIGVMSTVFLIYERIRLKPVTRVGKYKIGAAVQILETNRFILFRGDSFTRGQSNIRRFFYERSATNIRDWSLAYSFIYMLPGDLGHNWKVTLLACCQVTRSLTGQRVT